MTTYAIDLKPSISQQLADLKRERTLRQQVYPKLIASRKLSQKLADWQMACLDAAIRTLEHAQCLLADGCASNQ